MKLIEREPASHWYLQDGTPYYEVAKKDGTGNRPVTLADARKVSALPSVTNVLGVLAKPGLDAWKIEQGIMAALTLPRLENEPLDAFARRVVVDMGEQVEKAADFGSAIHAACENYAQHQTVPQDATLLGFFEPWQHWFDNNVEEVRSVERVCVNLQHGYAGRVDLVAKVKDIGWCVVDFKTQKVKRSAIGKPTPAFYETWPLQLAAYQQALASAGDRMLSGLVSVVIDSAQPGPAHVKVWAGEDYFKKFQAALELWRYVKNYDPRSFRTGADGESPAMVLTA